MLYADKIKLIWIWIWIEDSFAYVSYSSKDAGLAIERARVRIPFITVS